MKFNRFRIGGQIFLAGFYVALLCVMPFWFAVMVHLSSAVTLPGKSSPGLDLAGVRFSVLSLSLACALSAALASYIAPPGEERRYTRAALPFYGAFWLSLLIEAFVMPALFSGSASLWHRIGEFACALALNVLLFVSGKRLGRAARRQSQSIGARLLEKCRRLPVGHGFGGRKLRLNL